MLVSFDGFNEYIGQIAVKIIGYQANIGSRFVWKRVS